MRSREGLGKGWKEMQRKKGKTEAVCLTWGNKGKSYIKQSVGEGKHIAKVRKLQVACAEARESWKYENYLDWSGKTTTPPKGIGFRRGKCEEDRTRDRQRSTGPST